MEPIFRSSSLGHIKVDRYCSNAPMAWVPSTPLSGCLKASLAELAHSSRDLGTRQLSGKEAEIDQSRPERVDFREMVDLKAEGAGGVDIGSTVIDEQGPGRR